MRLDVMLGKPFRQDLLSVSPFQRAGICMDILVIDRLTGYPTNLDHDGAIGSSGRLEGLYPEPSKGNFSKFWDLSLLWTFIYFHGLHLHLQPTKMADEEGDLFNIAIDDSDEEEQKPRDWQSEEDFQKLRATYRVKVQDGDPPGFLHLPGEPWTAENTPSPPLPPVWQTIELPLNTEKASKPVLQELLHAVEELYFLRRFGEAAAFARRVLDGSEAALDRDTKETLVRYEEKCRGRMEK
ncbi:uncharacterized protein CLUP02_10494 [Colletotrichum lupini]|uniref:Uncharacterized protein n=1 Tax=Colletotrichum lupini TaxID=145971 RepID=A0A9Q8WIL4_9PEZI|nr:uncharacterized protein CLUP02_10494 [Colletotrichum lupini]UQC84998.1 hypothetical protein CLUP02_10494 [Colletotrichum lupini]